jgi:membrane protein DedA with SNARE-associated domain
MLTSLLHGLLSLRGWPAYLIPTALCFGEAAIFLGFVIPGEIAVVYGGVLAGEHHINLAIILPLVVVAAILGDTTGYFVGRFFGPALLKRWPLKDSKGVDRTTEFLQRRGGPAVFLGRFVSLFRALMPGMAGASELRFPVFLVYNAMGGIVWGTAFTLLGFVAGKSYQKVLNVIGSASSGLLAAIAVVIIALLVIRHRRSKRDERDDAAAKSD